MSKSLITIFVISVAFFVIGPVGGTQAGQLDLIIENVAFDEILHYPIITIKNHGDAKVLVWVDNKDGQQGIFEESNENNNTKIADLPLADLVIDSADFAYGSNKVVIKNQGNGRAIVPSPDRLKVTRLFLRADGTMIATTTQNLSVDSPIEPGQTVELSGFGFLPYAAKVRVTVDSTAEVLESNENNNDKIINRSQSTLTDFTVEIYGFDRNP